MSTPWLVIEITETAANILFWTVAILFIGIPIFSFINKIKITTKEVVDGPLPLEVQEKYDEKMAKIISNWISEEIERTQLIISTTGFNYTFLGRLANLNFKAIGIVPEVEIELKNQLKDTEEIRSFSHFLDLIRTLYLKIDPVYLEIWKERYFLGLSECIGPTPYTHDKKLLKKLKRDYPWLWLLEVISIHPKVQNFNARTSSVVTVDKTQQTERGLSIPKEDGVITM